MAVATAKTVFLHAPKTGGTWVRHAMQACGLSPYFIGDQHEHFPTLLNHYPESYYRDKFVFSVVRHPATWYQSRWAFRVRNGWQPKHPLDWNTASNNFQTFVENALEYKPDGWCTWLYRQYINSVPGMVRFVGRCETLADDFLQAMRLAGEHVDERIVRNLPRVNESTTDGVTSGVLALYTPELLARVLAVENEVVQTYYRDFPIDQNALCGHRAG
jgi:hypothetical protein